MKRFKIWYLADGENYVTSWESESKEGFLEDFWDWVIFEYDVVSIGCVEEVK